MQTEALLKGEDIICLASQSWNSHWSTPQQTMSRLASKNRILYVEPYRSLFALSGRLKAKETLRGGVQQEREGLWIYTPPPIFIPFALYACAPLLRRINNWLLSKLVQSVQKQLQFNTSLCWVYHVMTENAPLLKQSRLVIYDCIDEWSGLLSSPVLRRCVAKINENLCRTCDFLFVGSQTLYSTKANLNPNILLVPQGVDFSLFKKAAEAETEVPTDMQPIPHPIVGLTGVLDKDRINVELLCYLADHQPKVSIVLVGPVWKGLRTEELRRRRNIYLLGNKRIEDLPHYLRAFDVSIIPYIINDFTRNIYPLKLHEYMASGKPIVSTPIPAVAEFTQLVRIADNREEFRQHIMAALAEDQENLIKKRIAVAAANDWEQRVEKKSQTVKTLLDIPHGIHGHSLAGNTST